MSLFLFIPHLKRAREGSLPTTVILPASFSQNLPRSPAHVAEQKAEARFVRVVNFNYLSISLSTRISRAYPSSSFGVSR